MNQNTSEVCACALLHAAGRFLVAKRSPHKRLYPSLWDIIGGHAREGESIEAALIREAEEEIGTTPVDYRLVKTLLDSNPENSNRHDHIYLVTAWHGEPHIANSEQTELRWASVDEIRKLHLADDRHIELVEQLESRRGCPVCHYPL